MATPNVVPRADSEGQLGTTSKFWSTGYFDNFNIGNSVAANLIFTPEAGDTITFAASANGALTITTVDAAGAAANVGFVVDGAFDVDAAGAVTIDGSEITIGGDADVAVDIDASTLDIDASGALTMDSNSFSVDAVVDSNITVTGSGQNLSMTCLGGSTNVLSISSAGTGANAIDINATAGGIDIDVAAATTIDTTSVTITNITTSSASQGGKLVLSSDDGAVMADNHRLGVIEFGGAEDTSSTISVGSRIQSVCRDAWDGSNNDADLEFYTTDGTTQSKVLTLDADKLAAFTGAITAANDISTTQAVGAGTLAVVSGSTFGGGYGSTGAAISTAGVGQFNGALTTDGALTADNIVCTNAATFGGGTGSTGATITTAGVGTFDGAISSTAAAVTGLNYRTIYVDAGSMVPSLTGGAQAGTEELATSGVMQDYFAFDSSTDENVYFKLAMPEQYDGGTVKFKAYWRPKSSTTTSHDVTWSFLSIAHDDGDDVESALSLGNIVVINDEVLGTADTKLHITAATPAHTIAGVSAGGHDQLVYFRVTRDVSADDLNEDAYLLGVAIQYREIAAADAAW